METSPSAYPLAPQVLPAEIWKQIVSYAVENPIGYYETYNSIVIYNNTTIICTISKRLGHNMTTTEVDGFDASINWWKYHRGIVEGFFAFLSYIKLLSPDERIFCDKHGIFPLLKVLHPWNYNEVAYHGDHIDITLSVSNNKKIFMVIHAGLSDILVLHTPQSIKRCLEIFIEVSDILQKHYEKELIIARTEAEKRMQSYDAFTI